MPEMRFRKVGDPENCSQSGLPIDTSSPLRLMVHLKQIVIIIFVFVYTFVACPTHAFVGSNPFTFYAHPACLKISNMFITFCRNTTAIAIGSKILPIRNSTSVSFNYLYHTPTNTRRKGPPRGGGLRNDEWSEAQQRRAQWRALNAGNASPLVSFFMV